MLQALSSPFRNLVVGSLFVAFVMAAAAVAYVWQGWNWGDAIYMVVLTVYTVGFDEVRPINTDALRVITVTLIVTGCTGMLFLTGSLVQLITVSQFEGFFGDRRMQRDIDKLSGHVILCGYGRIGRSLAQDLKSGGASFVILDRGEQRLELARDHGFLTYLGDATDEAVLRQVKIGRARALATVLPDDATNVFVTLSARSLNEKLTIIARGEAPSTERKLIQAGADHVVLPTHIGAERIAELLLFAEMASLRVSLQSEAVMANLSRLGLDMEIVAAARGSRCVGATVAEIERLAAGAFMIVAIERKSGGTIMQPPPDARIQSGDGVAVVGRPERADAMQAIFNVVTAADA